MNYSTLLNRSLDWEGAYGELAYAFYPTKAEQQLLFALLQMLWDRGEANGYAQHMTADPLPGTPAKQVLLHAGYSDHQVTNLAAEVEARTLGATRIASDLPVCRQDRKSTRLNYSHYCASRIPSSSCNKKTLDTNTKP